jgi:hypothetical protein
MSRPRRGTEQVWYDLFMDWDLTDQAVALKMLEELHRQKRRMTQPTTKEADNGDTRSTTE